MPSVRWRGNEEAQMNAHVSGSLTQESLNEKAHRLIPGGSHTYAKGDDQYPANAPAFIARGRGCRVWDTDGREFVEHRVLPLSDEDIREFVGKWYAQRERDAAVRGQKIWCWRSKYSARRKSDQRPGRGTGERLCRTGGFSITRWLGRAGAQTATQTCC